MRYLPVSFDTKNKKILIFGGNELVLSRLKILLETEFKIYIISNYFINEIEKLSEKYPERLLLKKEIINNDFVFFGYDYVLIATDDFNLNISLENTISNTKTPYERCDITSNSDLIMNYVIAKEGLSIGITPNKRNPAITDIAEKSIENLYKNYDDEKIKLLNKIREILLKSNALNINDTIINLYDKDTIYVKNYLTNLTKNINTNKNNEIINKLIESKNIKNDVSPNNNILNESVELNPKNENIDLKSKKDE